MSTKIIVIGAGAIGSAIAYVLSKNSEYNITVLEQNSSIPGLNQSSRNAGVIHAGIYYSNKEEPLKSRMCVEGNKLLYEFCKKEGVPHKNVGKLIIATNEFEQEYIEYFYESAKRNNVPGVRLISQEEIKKLEPNIRAIKAIYVPSSGIVDSNKLVSKYKELSESNGVNYFTSTRVIDIQYINNGFNIKVKQNKRIMYFNSDLVINSAGLQSDVIAKMINKDSPYELLPTRGEFAEYVNKSDLKISRNVYPAPFGFYKETGEKAQVSVEEFLKLLKQGLVTRTVGVHITPTLNDDSSLGEVAIVGPVKTVKITRNNYTGKIKPITVFHKKISDFLPLIKKNNLKNHYTGIMASEKTHRDFIIERDQKYKDFINLIGMDSPGLTSSLAIANYVNNLISKR